MTDISESSIERDLHQAFPDLPSGRLRLLDRGLGSIAVEFNSCVFRIARSKKAADGHALEWRLLPQLANRLPAPVPHPRWYVERSEAFAFGVIGYEKLPGISLSEEAAGVHRNTLTKELAHFLVVLHGLPTAELGYVGLDGPEAKWQRLKRLHRDVMPLLREALTELEYAKVARWWEDFLTDKRMHNGHPSLRHGDFWHGNILVDQSSGRLMGVIDWEGAAIADPAEDLATLRHLAGSFANGVVDAYQAEGGLIDPGLAYRIDRYWELREFGGVVGAVEMNDQTEFAESVQKLRQGPILSARGSFARGDTLGAAE